MITNSREESISLGQDCYLDLSKEALVKNGLISLLSRIQFRILYFLAQQIGNPVLAEDLIIYVWGEEKYFNKNDLYVNVNRIRKVLETDPKKPQLLLSIRGIGYILFPGSCLEKRSRQ